MMGAQHRLTGGIAGLALAPVLGVPDRLAVPFALVTYASTMLPDLDEPASTLGRKVRPLSKVIKKVFGHRGATHWAATGVAVGWLVALVGPDWVGLGVGLGWVVGAAGDVLTVAGSPFLGPFWLRPIRLVFVRIPFTRTPIGSFRAGRRFELWVLRPLFVAALVCLFFWRTGDLRVAWVAQTWARVLATV